MYQQTDFRIVAMVKEMAELVSAHPEWGTPFVILFNNILQEEVKEMEKMREHEERLKMEAMKTTPEWQRPGYIRNMEERRD